MPETDALPEGRPDPTQRPEIGELEFEIWRDLIEQRCGTRFTDTRLSYLTRCLWQRMRPLGLTRYGDYFRRVAYGADGEGEWTALQELLLNRETGFFRHLPSFEALASRVVPELIAARARTGIHALSAWSAGCSAGQEAYSLAMVLLAGVDSGRWELKVSGSDVSETALELARRGRYRAAGAAAVPDLYRQRFLRRVDDPAGTCYEVGRELRAAVAFGRLNLNEPRDYWVGEQDVVFCQNVLIYFRPERRVDVVRELAGRLRPGGYLFLAPGEVVGLRLAELRAVHFDNSLAYQRCA